MLITYSGKSSGYIDDTSLLNARYNYPYGILFDQKRKCLLITDIGNHAIQKIDPNGTNNEL